MMLVGIAIAAMIVLRTLPRKRKTTTAARSAPTTRCSFTPSTLVRMTPESSRTTSSVSPAGSALLDVARGARCTRVDDLRPCSRPTACGWRGRRSARRRGWPRSRALRRRPRRRRRRGRGSSARPPARTTRSPISFGSLDAAVDAERELLGPGLDATARHREVLRRDRALHVERGDAGAAQLDRVEPDVDLTLLSAEDADLTDAVDRLELAANALVGELGHLLDRVARRYLSASR